jgi:hypothetical protein
MNSVEPGENLATACEQSSFKSLLFGLDGVVKNWDAEKGEFETTEAFEKRIADRDETLNGSRSTLVCWPLASETTFINYNADRQQYAVDSYRLQRVTTDDKDVGSYVSSTAMGAKVRVYHSVRLDYEVDTGSSGYAVPEKVGCKSTTFDVPVDEAPAVRRGGFLVLLGRLTSPYYTESTSRSQPSLTDPFDTETMTMALKLRPQRLLLVGPNGKEYPCRGAPGQSKAAAPAIGSGVMVISPANAAPVSSGPLSSQAADEHGVVFKPGKK